MNSQIAAEILAMAERDQAMRRAAIDGNAPWDREIDLANQRRLAEIVEQIGWPTRSRVGDAAEHAAWLLAQHAELAAQKHYLALMRAEPGAEVCAKHLAYLEDRIALREGRAQRYGTQLRGSAETGFEAATLSDPDQVDELRASVGLEPLAVYLERAGVDLRPKGERAKPR